MSAVLGSMGGAAVAVVAVVAVIGAAWSDRDSATDAFAVLGTDLEREAIDFFFSFSFSFSFSDFD